jgi:hypothetical protein
VADQHADHAISKTSELKSPDAEARTQSGECVETPILPGTFAKLDVILGGGLALLGVVAGMLALLDSATSGELTNPALAVRCLRALWLLLAFGLAGAAAFVAVRSMSILRRELIEQDSRRAHRLEESLACAVGLLERIARATETQSEAASSERSPESLPARPVNEMEQLVSELKAARAVNDAARVLELFGTISPALAPEPLELLQSEVAEWFLPLLYRRLRTGKIQLEVVELAGRFAESFATTAQGASVRAALPTLRRSAGLCPRCAQPYIGSAQACPECLRGGTTRAPAEIPASDADEEE